MNDIVPVEATEIVGPEPTEGSTLAVASPVFAAYLKRHGLPTDNIIASTEQRGVIEKNLPCFLGALSPDTKREARYLSKFVCASAVGLFDAALNFIWNEVVLNLRQKACIYGVDLFFDAAVGGNARDLYKDAEDLGGLKDSVLLDTCLKLELVSPIVHTKLAHILTMRNEVAASHPNVQSIGGYELLGWLETCVIDVLKDQPSESAIRIRSLLANIKAQSAPIDDASVGLVREELKKLSTSHVDSFLLAIFGNFCADASDNILRINIAKIGPAVWQCAGDDVKYQVGTILEGYRVNLHADRIARASEFLDLVGGKGYETLSARTMALDALSERLSEAHAGWDNFYHEPPVMREILSYIGSPADIPGGVLPKLCRVIIRCRLGRGISYQGGVSPSGEPLYDQFFGLLDESGIVHCIIALYRPEINARLGNAICQGHLTTILKNLRSVAISDRLKEVLDYLLADPERAKKANILKDFRDLSSPFISWKTPA